MTKAIFELMATAAFGLEAVVRRELADLGYEARVVQPGKLLWQGAPEAICRTNLWLRSADRVLLRVGAFGALDFGELFDRTESLPWEDYLPADANFPVTGRSVRSQLHHVPTCQKIVKKAIVNRLLKAWKRGTLDESGPVFAVDVGLLDDQVTLAIDTSGSGLHRRGYRKLVGEAPLRETLAAAMIQLSYWRAERPFLDPFCGSGTIPIEAAMIARRLAPGRHREFAAERWPLIGTDPWRRAREEADDAALPDLPSRLLATDIDPEALKLARFHAERAGVSDQIHFQRMALADVSVRREFGCLFANPPYGRRIGEAREVRQLYRDMPVVLRRLKNWSHWVLTADPDFESLIGQGADRRRKLYNGRIQCTLFHFAGPRPDRARAPGTITGETADSLEDDAVFDADSRHDRPRADSSTLVTTNETELVTAAENGDSPDSSSTARRPVAAKQAFGGLSDKSKEQAELFERRLEKRARHLRRWPTKQGITCYRLYDRDVPEIPLTVDRYGPYARVVEFDRPHERSVAEHADWLDALADVVRHTLDLNKNELFLNPVHSVGSARDGNGDSFDVDVLREVDEAGLRFLVRLDSRDPTGLSLDQRVVRRMIRDSARDRRCLLVGTGSAAAAVAAAAGGANHLAVVSPSSETEPWLRANLDRNGLGTVSRSHVPPPVFESNAEPRGESESYGLAMIDLPQPRANWLPDDWRRRELERLVRQVLPRLSPEGELLVYARSKSCRLTLEDPRWLVREITRQTVPDDFRDRRVHRCWRITARR